MLLDVYSMREADNVKDISTESIPNACPSLWAVCSIKIDSAPNSDIKTADLIIVLVISDCFW